MKPFCGVFHLSLIFSRGVLNFQRVLDNIWGVKFNHARILDSILSVFHSSSVHLSTSMVSRIFSMILCHIWVLSQVSPLKIRWFISFQIPHSINPRDKCHALFKTSLWKPSFLHLIIVSFMLALSLSIFINSLALLLHIISSISHVFRIFSIDSSIFLHI